ncbi:peptidase M24, structural domain-containing protein [Lanmaoa asiatica]|nr:peptidase M24, structural domain-containing protein [Lanmaoa asiatica]
MIPKLIRRKAWTGHPLISSRPWTGPESRLRFLSTHTSDEEASFGNYSVILPEEPFVWGVSHITPRTVPSGIGRPPYAQTGADAKPTSHSSRSGPSQEPYEDDSRILLGSEEETKLRAASMLARKIREFSGTLVRPGVTTNSIDTAIHDFIVAHGAYPSPLLYSGFPRSCCTSINNVVTHGIPDECVAFTYPEAKLMRNSRPLEDGDIINIDITVFLSGYHGDTSQTFLVGTVVRTHPSFVGGYN